MTGTLRHALDTAREALDRGDWASARSLLDGELSGLGADGGALDPDARAEAGYLLARTLEWAGEYGQAIERYEQAFRDYRKLGELRTPALIAGRELSFLHAAVYGNEAVAAGWLERARRLAAAAGDCVELGWVELATALTMDDPDAKEPHVRAAAALADRFSDADLGFCALCYEGTMYVLRGHIGAGMRRIDEAAAAAAGGEVKDYIAVGEIFCQMLLCCEMSLDVRRAEQWTAIATSFAHQRNAPWVSALCRTHYGGILTAAGRWADAEHELTASVRLYDASYPALRSSALVRLADLRVRQGRYDEAARLLAGFEFDSYAVRPLARLHLMRAEIDLARRVLERALDPADHPLRIPELALLVEVELIAGDLDAARAVSARVATVSTKAGVPQFEAIAAYADGATRASAGDPAALSRFERALQVFAASGLPVEEARTRLAISRLVAASAPEIAVTEARAALAIFDRLAASAYGDAAAQQLRTLGVTGRTIRRTAGPLTAREAEILRLVCEGLDNEHIARRLVISRRTVEHHVGNIFAKLGVQTRAAAVAHQLRRGAE